MTFHHHQHHHAPSDAATAETQDASAKKTAALLGGARRVDAPTVADAQRAVLHLPPRAPARSAASRDPLAHG